MKTIAPDTTVFINDVPRSPAEGPFTVPDEYAAHLKRNGVLTDDQITDAEPPAKAAGAKK